MLHIQTCVILGILCMRTVMFASANVCPDYFDLHPFYHNQCFYRHTQKLSWIDGEALCAAMQGHLAIVPNKVTHDFVTYNLSTSELYSIGLLENYTSGLYKWLDNIPLHTWDVWGPEIGEPVGTSCVFYKHYNTVGWGWFRDDCGSNLSYPLCQYSTKDLGVALLALVEGPRAEVFHNSRWGTINAASPTDELGTVICSAFGFIFVGFEASVLPGTGLIWLSNVNCSLGADNIDSCVSNDGISWGNITGQHNTDIGVNCADPNTVSTTEPSTSTDVTYSPECLHTYNTVTQTVTESISVTLTAAEPTYSASCLDSYLTVTQSVTESVSMTFTEACATTPAQLYTATSFPVALVATPTLQAFSTALIANTTNQTTQSTTTFTTAANSHTSQPPTTSYFNVSSIPKIKKSRSAAYSTHTRYDGRPSSVAIGSLGIFMLVGFAVFFLMLDLITIGKTTEDLTQCENPRKKSPNKKENAKNNDENDNENTNAVPNSAPEVVLTAGCSGSQYVNSNRLRQRIYNVPPPAVYSSSNECNIDTDRKEPCSDRHDTITRFSDKHSFSRESTFNFLSPNAVTMSLPSRQDVYRDAMFRIPTPPYTPVESPLILRGRNRETSFQSQSTTSSPLIQVKSINDLDTQEPTSTDSPQSAVRSLIKESFS